MTYSPYFAPETVDETAQATEMQGPSSAINQLAGKATWLSSPTKSLAAMWFLVLIAYWFVGWFFRGQRS